MKTLAFLGCPLVGLPEGINLNYSNVNLKKVFKKFSSPLLRLNNPSQSFSWNKKFYPILFLASLGKSRGIIFYVVKEEEEKFLKSFCQLFSLFGSAKRDASLLAISSPWLSIKSYRTKGVTNVRYE